MSDGEMVWGSGETEARIVERERNKPSPYFKAPVYGVGGERCPRCWFGLFVSLTSNRRRCANRDCSAVWTVVL